MLQLEITATRSEDSVRDAHLGELVYYRISVLSPARRLFFHSDSLFRDWLLTRLGEAGIPDNSLPKTLASFRNDSLFYIPRLFEVKSKRGIGKSMQQRASMFPARSEMPDAKIRISP
jgi:hypothetical protein